MAGDTQPRAGDVVLFCAHEDPRHWWRVSIGFRRPNGSFDTARWVLACDKCFARSDGDPLKVPIVGDGVWEEGDAPITFEPKS
jgi:hypothetical protein